MSNKYVFSTKKINLFLMLLFFPFLGLHGLFSAINQQAVGFILFILYLFFFILFLYYSRYKIVLYKKGSLTVTSLIILITIGYFQYLLYGNMTIGEAPPVFVPVVLFLSYVLINTLSGKVNKNEILRFLFYSYLLFFFINIILHLLGISFLVNEDHSETFRKNIFVSLDREYLPLFMHATETSEAGLLTMIIALILLQDKKHNIYFKVVFALLIIFGFYGILLGGARSGLLGMVIVLFLLVSKLYKSYKITFMILCLLYLFPLWYTLLTYIIIDNEIFSVLSEISRTGDYTEVLTLNNRTIIWKYTFLTYVNNVDLLHLFFGYGFGGQFPSGVSSSFAQIFSLRPGDPAYDIMHVHNSTLQILIDYGIVGVTLFAYILFKLFRVFYFNKDYELNILLIIFLLIGCFGVSSMSFSYVFMTLFLLMVLFINKTYFIRYRICNMDKAEGNVYGQC